MLNHSHKPARRMSEEHLVKVTQDLVNVKERIRVNIIENVRSQCDSETYYYCWSGLGLKLKLSISQRKEHWKDIVVIFCTTKIFTVQKYIDANEKETEDDDSWEGFNVILTYQPDQLRF